MIGALSPSEKAVNYLTANFPFGVRVCVFAAALSRHHDARGISRTRHFSISRRAPKVMSVALCQGHNRWRPTMKEPFKQNDVFEHVDLDQLNACVGNNGGPYDLYDYAKGYFDATKTLLAHVRDEGNLIDLIVYPICFNFATPSSYTSSTSSQTSQRSKAQLLNFRRTTRCSRTRSGQKPPLDKSRQPTRT